MTKQAEGHDDKVLEQYPWGIVPTYRVIYEQSHIGEARHIKTMKLLRSHGYENVHGWASTAMLSVWHHVNSSEALQTHAARDGRHPQRGVAAIGS